jgi:hypothetical protein
MWRKVEVELPEELAAKTSSVWEYPDIMQIGVMRESMLSPPWLWAKVLKGGFRNVRRAPELLDDLQYVIAAPIVFAEAAEDLRRNQDLLLYLGFQEIGQAANRFLYRRSL